MSVLDPIRVGLRRNITGATTLSVRFSIHLRTNQKKDEIVSLRLKEKRDRVCVGELEIRCMHDATVTGVL